MKRSSFLFSLLICFYFLQTTNATVKLPAIFTSNMVLQQQSEVPFWGEATPNKTVQITTSWNKKVIETQVKDDGKWQTKVSTPTYGGPYSITISDGAKIILENVMIGEVWLCSGQSNMEMPLAGWGKVLNYEQEIANANYPNIRFFEVERNLAAKPITELKAVDGGWVTCSPKTVAEFSSVAYFFGKNLFINKEVPVGLINTSWGGTIAEAWTSGEALKTMPDFKSPVIGLENKTQFNGNFKKDYENALQQWQIQVEKLDKGYTNGKAEWAKPSFDCSEWKAMNIPSFIEQNGLADFDGIVWLRKTIDIPASWENKVLTLNLNTIDDNDITFFNGVKVGQTDGYSTERSYIIPAKLIRKGKAVITVRLLDTSGKGGIYGDASKINLKLSSNEQISLAGNWLYKATLKMSEVASTPASWDDPNQPTLLYNAMIYPMVPFTIKGAIWYQGESNADRAYQYRELFPLLIKDWRKQWNINFPFYFVQLANYTSTKTQPSESNWAELREAQLKTLHLEKTGMAVTIDIGDTRDIHPKNKQEVGRRLSLIARANLYGENIPFSGPEYQSFKIEGNTIRIKFQHAKGGLHANNGESLKGFEISGLDHKFEWAEARIDGNDVVVYCKTIENPIAVRYAWAENPICNLYNNADLPASPFRTDDWKGVTFEKK